MGLTGHSYELMMRYAKKGDSILELGNQTIYFGEDYGKPAKPMFEKAGFKHTSIDINGQDGAIPLNLSSTILSFNDNVTEYELLGYDIVTDFGTSEHVENFYRCWQNKHNLCKINGYIISENPKTGNWKGHGPHYLTQSFYQKLAYMTGYEIMEIGEHPAMQNTTDGWNIYCVLKKLKDSFITQKQFETLDYRKT